MHHLLGVRVGMIGCGTIALAVHLPTLVGMPGVAVVSVADPHPASRAAAMQVARDARAFESADALLEAGGVDAVVLAMPSPQHAATAIAAMQAGYHVYVEKPVATSACDAQRLLDVWQQSACLGVAGFNYRQHPLVQQARALLQDGVIGDVIALQTVFSSRPAVVPAWKRQEASGGALFDKGAHHVDLAAFLLGAYPEVVTARTSSRRTVGDTTVFDGLFSNGVSMQSVFSFDGVAEDRITVIGQTGRLSFDRLAGVTVERSHGPVDRAVFGRARALMSAAWREPFARTRLFRPDAEPSFARALGLFVDAVGAWSISPGVSVTGSPGKLPTLVDGVRCLEVLLAARESSQQGTRVAVRPIADLVSRAGVA